jgi:hypothetical protein
MLKKDIKKIWGATSIKRAMSANMKEWPCVKMRVGLLFRKK